MQVEPPRAAIYIEAIVPELMPPRHVARCVHLRQPGESGAHRDAMFEAGDVLESRQAAVGTRFKQVDDECLVQRRALRSRGRGRGTRRILELSLRRNLEVYGDDQIVAYAHTEVTWVRDLELREPKRERCLYLKTFS